MRTRRLRRRIYWHLIVVLLIGIFASAIVFFAGFRNAFLRAAAERLARHAASQIGAVFADDEARDRAVHRISDELDLDLTVRDLDNKVLSASGRVFPELSAEELAHVKEHAIVVERFRRHCVAAPIYLHGQLAAVLEASPMYRRFHMPGLLRPIAILALVLLIAGVASGPLAKRISLPIERMTDTLHRFGVGDLSARLPTWGRPHRVPHEIAQLTRAFNEMAERIEHLVRGHKELLANVSHELRSPLARIRVALELLPRDEASQRRLDDIEGDLAELDRLIEDVLTASRLDAGRLPLHAERVVVADILKQLGERARLDPLTAATPVTVSGGDGLALVADGALIKRALWNLLQNAAKYGAPPITLSASVDGEALRFCVSDAGAGIPLAERERIFEPFYRADKARTPGRGGFGLGLTLARRVAEVHGGTICAQPAEIVGGVEHGTRIVLRIPLAPA